MTETQRQIPSRLSHRNDILYTMNELTSHIERLQEQVQKTMVRL